MACRNTRFSNNNVQWNDKTNLDSTFQPNMGCAHLLSEPLTAFLGVDSSRRADTILQNNLTLFEWASRNKSYPNFWGRFIGGENALTKEEAEFIHTRGCKIAPIYNGAEMEKMQTKKQGMEDAKKAFVAAAELGIPLGTVLFLRMDSNGNAAAEYMLGYAETLMKTAYIPGFYANTDANIDFDHQLSRGYQENPEIFGQCFIWALSPDQPEFFQTTNAHRLHPDFWGPYSPSCMTQDQIAVWQYGRQCHPINDYTGLPTFFNINLVKDKNMIVENMF